MAIDRRGPQLWDEVQNLPPRMRDMIQRGYLLKTHNKGKLLKARVKTGVDQEWDELDVVSPVGLVSHVKSSPKAEILTINPRGDPSRKLVLVVFGDRATHPKPDENEIVLYSPSDPEIYTSYKKTRDGQAAGDSDTADSGREAGIHSDAKDQNTSTTTKGAASLNADKGIGETTQGNITSRAGGNVQTEGGGKLISTAEEMHLKPTQGKVFVEGMVHAGDVLAGGGTDIQASRLARAGEKEYGATSWTANGREGIASLIQTAAAVGSLTTQFNAFQGSQQGQNQQTSQQIQDILQLIAALEARIVALGG